MIITLLHPSRGRAQKAKTTREFWYNQASGKIKIEHILSLDFSDPANDEYERFDKVTVDHNESVVEATNEAAKMATGDILVYLSDDFECPKDWDLSLVEIFKDVNKPLLAKVDDCLQSFDTKVLTIPIMNRALYEKLKYFWHYEYKSMFVDEDLYWTCFQNGWLAFYPELKFPHNHCSNGKADRDETYIRSEANWNQGKAVFAKRKEAGFPL